MGTVTFFTHQLEISAPGLLVYQSPSSPASTVATEGNIRSDSQPVGNAATEDETDGPSNSQGTWVVDTITLAEYEAQLKAQGKSVSDPANDPADETAADAYFDRFSAKEIDASIVSDNDNAPQPVDKSAMEGSSSAVPLAESTLLTDTIARPLHEPDPIATAEPIASPQPIAGPQPVAGQAEDSIADRGTDTELATLPAQEIAGERNETVASLGEIASGSLEASVESPVATVIESVKSDWTSRFNVDPSVSVLVAASLGIPLFIMLLMWNIGNLLAWNSRRRERRWLRLSAAAEQSDPWRPNRYGGDLSLDREGNQHTEHGLSKEKVKNDTTIKMVGLLNRDNQLGDRVRSANALLESQLLAAQESLDLVRANGQRRDSKFQAKTRMLDEQLNAKTEDVKKLQTDLSKAKKTIALHQSNEQQLLAKAESIKSRMNLKTEAFSKLESELQTSKEAIAFAQVEGDKRNAALLNDIGRLKKALSNKTGDFIKLKSDFLSSEEELSAAKTKSAQRERDLLVDLELLGEELSAQTENSAKLEASLIKVQKSLDARADVERELELEHQVRVETLEKKLRAQSNTVTKLESKLSKAEKALVDSHSDGNGRVNELQLKLQRLEEKLKSETSTSAKKESDLREAKETLANEKARSSQLESEMAEVKGALEDQQENETRRVTDLKAGLTKAELEVEQLRSKLSSEQEATARSEQKLAESKSKVSKLRKKLSSAAVNRSNYMKLAKKVVRYKKLYRANEAKVQQLRQQNIQLLDLASEYLEAADGMIGKLDVQAKRVADIKQRMLTPESNKLESPTLPNDDLQIAEPNDLVQSQPHEDSLAVREDSKPTSHDSSFVTPNGHSEDFDQDQHRIKLPR